MHSVRSDVFRACACGAAYSVGAWRKLRRIGFMDLDDDDRTDVELRICVRCRSSLSVEVPYPGSTVPPPA